MSKRDFMGTGHSPSKNLIHDRDQCFSLWRQAVFDLRRHDRELLAVDESALLEVLELPAENARRDRLPQRSQKQRLANLTVSFRAFDQHPQDAQLVLSAGQLIERDERAEFSGLLLHFADS
jgi:hypothetical protein